MCFNKDKSFGHRHEEKYVKLDWFQSLRSSRNFLKTSDLLYRGIPLELPLSRFCFERLPHSPQSLHLVCSFSYSFIQQKAVLFDKAECLAFSKSTHGQKQYDFTDNFQYCNNSTTTNNTYYHYHDNKDNDDDSYITSIIPVITIMLLLISVIITIVIVIVVMIPFCRR